MKVPPLSARPVPIPHVLKTFSIESFPASPTPSSYGVAYSLVGVETKVDIG